MRRLRDSYRILRLPHAQLLRGRGRRTPLGQKARAYASSVAPGSHLGMVGRHAERSALRAALDGVRVARGTVVMFTGDPGIGKTTLLEWLASEAARTNIRAYWGRCWEGGGGVAYWPWVQVLRACLSDCNDDEVDTELEGRAAALSLIVPELAGRLPGGASLLHADMKDARPRLFQAVAALLVHLSREFPLLVAFDDLHAADEASLLLLAHLASRLEGSNVLVVGAYREPEARSSPRLERLLRRIETYGQRLEMRGLDERDVTVLVQQATGRSTVAHLARRLHETTDGNPFFVLEWTRLLAAEGKVVDRAPAPKEAHTIVRRRLEPLGDRVRHVLGVAAVLGREFDLQVLQRASGLPVEVLVDDLAVSASAGVVDEVGLGRWSFRHALLRESLYEDLPAPERSRLHGCAGEALEQVHFAHLDLHAPELAHHYFHSPDPRHQRRAVRYCQTAAQAAQAVSAYEEAALLFRRALEALEGNAVVDERRRAELLLSLGDAMSRSGDFPGARATFRRALRSGRAAGSPELVGRAALGFAGVIETVSDPERVAVLREAVGLVSSSDSALRAQLLLALAGALHRGWPKEHGPEARRLSEEALGIARRCNDGSTLASVLLAWHLNAAFFGPETLETRLAVVDELHDRAAAAGDLRLLAQAHQWRAVDLFEAGEIAAMEAELDVAAGLAAQLREPFLIWATSYPRAALALLRGDLDAAERLAQEALAIGEQTEFTDVETMFSGQWTEIRYQQGRLGETEDRTRRRPERFNRAQEDTTVFLARVLAEVGRVDEARRAYDSVFGDIVAGRSGMWVLLQRAVLAEVCWALEDAVGAAAIYEAMLPFAGAHVVNGIAGASNGSADRHLGCLATLLGRFDVAEHHFEDAHRMHARMGARTWLAHGQFAQARMLLARRGPEDGPKAVALLTRAGDEFREMGMRLYEERATTLLAALVGGERGSFRRDGGEWALEYQGVRTRLRDTTGVRYLATLLACPGRQMPASEIAGVDDAERARQSVRRAVRGTIERISEAHPELAHHLESTVRIGRVACYMPDAASPIVWDIALGAVAPEYPKEHWPRG